MSIEKSIEEIKIQDLIEHIRFGTQLKYAIKDYIYSIETLLTAYEKEKEKNKKLEKFIENGEYTWKQKYNETFEYFKQELEEKETENKRLRKCHLQYEEMTGIDLLLPEKEE